MRTVGKETIINIVVMTAVLSIGSVVIAARNDWRVPYISFEDKQEVGSNPPKAVALMAEPTPGYKVEPYYNTPTPIPTPPWTNTAPCPCLPPATPVPPPMDPDSPPAPTPTPDTSGATGPFTITVNPFL